ncbi:nuclease-related domain-containing protein [Streptomyces sp. NPDC046821]|uniref:nuclease-related domain-containing protein n=1 Tax=Streptomyces sp. NPDC046821 TaxID=3154702 RepID=UPI0033FC52A4
MRAHVRRGVWRRVTAWAGMNPQARRADAQAALWAHGAAEEEATARLLRPLAAVGWGIRHDLALPRSGANLDHVLVAPHGRLVVVRDTKTWRRNWTTTLVQGRVHCGPEDRHKQVVAVSGYARRVQDALTVPDVMVLALLVVHGSTVAGHFLSVPVQGFEEPVHVLAADWLVSTLTASGRQAPADPARVAAVVRRVDQVLRPYGQGERR